MILADPPAPLLNEWLTLLAESGYRVTVKNRAIIEIILDSRQALDPITLFDMARQEIPGIGLVTVYRTLQKLEELGLVERLHHPNGCHMVLRATRGHEHLLLCSKCGQVEYFSGDNLDHLFEKIARQSGFSINSHWLQLFGVCPACQVTAQ